ncbi:MAG: hypothetical protein GW914_04060, partial [Candidatus Aenigmarchaeota archaeon]|nr:hypothetical protein [Candidatus Aenigmarchaeota archaeon]
MANKAAKGKRANTRHSHKGKTLTIENLLKEFSIGDKVVIKANGTYQKGLPFRRFAGHIGVIESKVGRSSYMVYVKDMDKKQIVGNAHL